MERKREGKEKEEGMKIGERGKEVHFQLMVDKLF